MASSAWIFFLLCLLALSIADNHVSSILPAFSIDCRWRRCLFLYPNIGHTFIPSSNIHDSYKLSHLCIHRSSCYQSRYRDSHGRYYGWMDWGIEEYTFCFTHSYFSGGDIVEEWEMYKSTLVEHGYFNNSFWLDIRGNHDNSNQQSGIRHSYYNYSTCGHEGPVFNKVYTRPFGRYCFIGLDATLSPCIPSLFFHSTQSPRRDDDVFRLRFFGKPREASRFSPFRHVFLSLYLSLFSANPATTPSCSRTTPRCTSIRPRCTRFTATTRPPSCSPDTCTPRWGTARTLARWIGLSCRRRSTREPSNAWFATSNESECLLN